MLTVHPILTCGETRALEERLLGADAERAWAAMQRAGAGVGAAAVSYTHLFGLQIGGGNTKFVAFLMTDEGMTGLTDNKLVWGGDARAVAGPSAASTQTIDDSADVIIYQQTSGLDVGASFSGVKISNNNDGNRKFYDNATLTPSDIFSGTVTTPDAAKPLIAALNKQASAGK